MTEYVEQGTLWGRFTRWLRELFGPPQETQAEAILQEPIPQSVETPQGSARDNLAKEVQSLRGTVEDMERRVGDLRKAAEMLSTVTEALRHTDALVHLRIGTLFCEYLADGRRGDAYGFATWMQDKGELRIAGIVADCIIDANEESCAMTGTELKETGRSKPLKPGTRLTNWQRIQGGVRAVPSKSQVDRAV